MPSGQRLRSRRTSCRFEPRWMRRAPDAALRRTFAWTFACLAAGAAARCSRESCQGGQNQRRRRHGSSLGGRRSPASRGVAAAVAGTGSPPVAVVEAEEEGPMEEARVEATARSRQRSARSPAAEVGCQSCSIGVRAGRRQKRVLRRRFDNRRAAAVVPPCRPRCSRVSRAHFLHRAARLCSVLTERHKTRCCPRSH